MATADAADSGAASGTLLQSYSVVAPTALAAVAFATAAAVVAAPTAAAVVAVVTRAVAVAVPTAVAVAATSVDTAAAVSSVVRCTTVAVLHYEKSDFPLACGDVNVMSVLCLVEHAKHAGWAHNLCVVLRTESKHRLDCFEYFDSVPLHSLASPSGLQGRNLLYYAYRVHLHLNPVKNETVSRSQTLRR